ncbi:MAG: Gfo/Idh/MocA family oxidoreductase [Ruthenibacterium lactatiformans]
MVVSFPLRLSSITLEMKRIVDSGVLGRLTMVQAVNNVPYGSVYYHSWYRDPAETGGLFLQKATHDIDYIHFSQASAPFPCALRPPSCISKGTIRRACTVRIARITAPAPKAATW